MITDGGPEFRGDFAQSREYGSHSTARGNRTSSDDMDVRGDAAKDLAKAVRDGSTSEGQLFERTPVGVVTPTGRRSDRAGAETSTVLADLEENSTGKGIQEKQATPLFANGVDVDYGFCYTVNRPCLDCRLLTLRIEGPHFLFEHLVNGCESLARVSEKTRDGPSKSSSVVAEQRGWSRVALVVTDVSWAHEESPV